MIENDLPDFYLDEYENQPDLESDQVWDEYGYEDGYDADGTGDIVEDLYFVPSNYGEDAYDTGFGFSDVNESGYYDADNAPRRLPWQGFIYGITMAACVFLGGMLYLFTGSVSIEEANKSMNAPLEASATQISGGISAESDQSQNPNGECRVNPAFPQAVWQWCGLITDQAEKRGLPPDLIAALILQESGGNPEAYSRSGAVGLMQVMPRDGLAAAFMCVNGPCFSNRPSTSELHDPAFNVSYGTKMLAGLFNRHGNFREALRSYGPMDVGYSYADKVLGIYQRYGN